MYTKMISVDEVLKQIQEVQDLILSELSTDKGNQAEETITFSKHIISTKSWFARISSVNKKKFLLDLLQDLDSVWAVSLILKSIWNCRPKDAIISISESRMITSYDRAPMDHDRTARPAAKLNELMLQERQWFNSLQPERQALFLSELLAVSGGPIMWDALRCCQRIYERHVCDQTMNLQSVVVVNEPIPEKPKTVPEPPKKEPPQSRKSAIYESDDAKLQLQSGQEEKELESQLTAWSLKMKALRDSMKLEELEQVFVDGSKRKVWRVNRSKSDTTETVDLIQLLPSAIAKKILLCLPLSQLGDCARVNKYWAYLIDDIRLELVARQKINIELEKMRDNIMRHDDGLHLFKQPIFPVASSKTAQNTHSKQKVGFKGLKMKKIKNPIPNLRSLHEQLNSRGAADEHIWKWCSNVLKFYKEIKVKKSNEHEGLMMIGNTHFPCPMLGHGMTLPLNPLLTKDPKRCEL